MVKIANLVFNPFINDSRVIKESNSLASKGYHVGVKAYLNCKDFDILHCNDLNALEYLNLESIPSEK